MNSIIKNETCPFYINSVLSTRSNNDTEKIIFERILWIDPNEERIITINILDTSALPDERSLNTLEQLYKDGSVSILDYYKKSKHLISEDCISDRYKQKRESAWNLIKDIINKEPEIYYPKQRGELINNILKGTISSKKTIYKYLRKYWQNGMIKNALLPNYDLCGGKGKEKKNAGNKRGRNRKHDQNPRNGINISDADKKLFQKAIKDFYNTHEKRPLRTAYEKMLFRDYLIGYIEENGVPIPILRPQEQLPTYIQFEYWCEKLNDIKNIIIYREGEKAFELRHRPVLGKSTNQAFGPGSRFQIDSTIADVYLVNSLTRDKVMKRVTIYAVMDVFTRYTAGIYVGLENPSWIGAAMALANAGMDKVEYCKQYGIDIKKDDWITEYMPEVLTADRGELEGDKPNNLINTLGVDVEILPPYRADWKGIVEYEFRRLNLAAILWLPGAVKKLYRERGEKDYRLGAALTLQELTAIIIRCVLFYNNKHRMNWYDRNEFQIADKVCPIPSNLWKWGMENCTGKLRKYPEDILKLNLMPSCDARVTHHGIKIDKYYYTCETAIREDWFVKARNYKTWKIPMSYDPRKMEYAYIRLNDGRDYEKCYLLESSATYKNVFLEDILEYGATEREDIYNNIHEELQAKAERDAYNIAIIESGVKLTNENSTNISDRQKISQIRQTTNDERMHNRITESFNLPDKNNDNAKEQTQDEDEYIPAAKYD